MSKRKYPGESDKNIFARVASREVRLASEKREVVLSVHGGVVMIENKPKNITVKIFDYDVEGFDNLDVDADGETCHIMIFE